MKRRRLVFLIAVTMLALPACSSTSNNLGGAMEGYETRDGYSDTMPYDERADWTDDRYDVNSGYHTDYGYGYDPMGQGETNSAVYWDGYGINNGFEGSNVLTN